MSARAVVALAAKIVVTFNERAVVATAARAVVVFAARKGFAFATRVVPLPAQARVLVTLDSRDAFASIEREIFELTDRNMVPLTCGGVVALAGCEDLNLDSRAVDVFADRGVALAAREC